MTTLYDYKDTFDLVRCDMKQNQLIRLNSNIKYVMISEMQSDNIVIIYDKNMEKSPKNNYVIKFENMIVYHIKKIKLVEDISPFKKPMEIPIDIVYDGCVIYYKETTIPNIIYHNCCMVKM